MVGVLAGSTSPARPPAWTWPPASMLTLPPTAYLVAKVKITLNLAAGPGWNEIDAVQLVGAAP